MAHLHIKNGTVVLKDALLKNSAVSIEGPKIVEVGKSYHGQKGSLTIDAKGCFVSAGFIDSHIHGAPEDIYSNETRYGTTSVVLALSCDRLEGIYDRVDEIKRIVSSSSLGLNILGVRLEGPYISKKKAGAQNKRYIKSPDKKELLNIIERCAGLLKIVTIAPELKGAIALIRLLNRKNIIASIGHSDATYEEAIKAIDSGVRHATHIFNAMRGMDTREPGIASAALIDGRVAAEIILDLVHVNEALFGLLLRIKGIDKTILVTDSVRADTNTAIKKRDGAYRFRSGGLAGSYLTMIDAIKNAVKVSSIGLPQAVRLATLNPAALLGVANRKGAIARGMDADIVIFDKDFDVKVTMVKGMVVYKKKDFNLCAA